MFTRNWYKAVACLFAINSKSVSFTNVLGTDFSFSSYTDAIAKFGSTTDGYSTPSMLKVRTGLSQNGGVYFGTGTTVPTIDDYTLSGEIITTISWNVNYTTTVNDDGGMFKGVYTITNKGTETITIGEVALMAGLNGSGTTYKILLERTVLDSPVTIEPSGVGQVTYTIEFKYPTA